MHSATQPKDHIWLVGLRLCVCMRRVTWSSYIPWLGHDWVAVKELKLSYHNGYIGFRV